MTNDYLKTIEGSYKAFYTLSEKGKQKWKKKLQPLTYKEVNDFEQEFIENNKDHLLKQPKIPSRLVWFLLGLICGSVGMLVYLMWLAKF